MIELLGFQISIVDLGLSLLLLATAGLYHFNGIKMKWALIIIPWIIVAFALGVYSIKAYYVPVENCEVRK